MHPSAGESNSDNDNDSDDHAQILYYLMKPLSNFSSTTFTSSGVEILRLPRLAGGVQNGLGIAQIAQILFRRYVKLEDVSIGGDGDLDGPFLPRQLFNLSGRQVDGRLNRGVGCPK